MVIVFAGLGLHVVGWLWHDIFHGHEGLETLRTQAVFYVATVVVLAGAVIGLARATSGTLRAGYAVVLAAALVETIGWIWDFAAHYGGRDSAAAHGLVYAASAIAVLVAIVMVITVIRVGRWQRGAGSG